MTIEQTTTEQMTNAITSKRLVLRLMDIEVLQALLRDDRGIASRLLACEIPPDLSLVQMPLARRLRQLHEDPSVAPWLVRGIVNRASNTMIGHIGFHSPPRPLDLANVAADGVEMGYTIEPLHRRQGYAKEAAIAMMWWAFTKHDQRCFVLSVSPSNIASTAMTVSLGFTPCSSHIDAEDGLEIVFVRRFEFWPAEWNIEYSS